MNVSCISLVLFLSLFSMLPQLKKKKIPEHLVCVMYIVSTSVSNIQKRQCYGSQKCLESWGSIDPLSDLTEAMYFKPSDSDLIY